MPENIQQRNAAREVKKAVRKGLLTLPTRCAKCDAEPSYPMAKHFPDYDDFMNVVLLCRKCNVARLGSFPHTYEGRVGYEKMKHHLMVEGLGYRQIGELYNMNHQALHRTFRRQAQRCGEWEEIHAFMEKHKVERLVRGQVNAKKMINGVMILGLVEDYLEEVKLFRVTSSREAEFFRVDSAGEAERFRVSYPGEAEEAPKTHRLLAFKTRARFSENTLRKLLKNPDQDISRAQAIRLMEAIGEPLPNHWPEGRAANTRRWHRENREGRKRYDQAKRAEAKTNSLPTS